MNSLTCASKLCLFMKHVLLSCAVLVFTFNNFAQQTSHLLIKSGHHVLSENVDQATNLGSSFSKKESNDGYAYRIVSLTEIPSNEKKKELSNNGITLLRYLPKNNYYAKVSMNSVILDSTIIGIHEIDPSYKLTAELNGGFYPTHSLVGRNNMKLNAMLFKGEWNEKLKETLLLLGATSIVEHSQEYITLTFPIPSLSDLYLLNEFYFFEAVEEESTPVNQGSRTSHASNYLHGDNGTGLQFDGTGINIMMTDDGFIGPHIDYKGRINQDYCTNCDPDPETTHGDHVAGTIMGAGNVNPSGRGMAIGSKLFVANAASGFGAFDNHVPLLYDSDSLVLTSRSYRNGCGGSYNARSHSMDEQTRLHPNLLHVCAAANEGEEDCGYGVVGWGNISDVQQAAKNTLVVGAMNKSNVIAGFSSRGPLADGRLKPDVCGVGVSVFSAQPENTYASWNGTSMSTPGVTGTMAQLYEAYKSINSGDYPKSGLMKAIVMNSADDVGNDGPDFIHGYGKINGRRAYRVLEGGTYFSDSVAQGENDSYTINVPAGISELKIMLYWMDYEASPSSSMQLINDLNLVVTDPSMIAFNPWVLDHTPDVSNLSALAVRIVDTLNNAEQVTIDNPEAGTYQLDIDGFSIPQGPQEYFLVYEFVQDEITVVYPNGGEGLEAGPSNLIRWDAPSGVDEFDLEYTIDDGSSWNSIATVASDLRHYSWYTPDDVISGLSRVRITRNGISDASDTTFTIADSPDNLTILWACPDSLMFTWDTVSNVTGYDVSLLGLNFMESNGITANTSMVLQIPSTDTTWLTVQTLGSNNARSERAISIEKLPGQFGCTWSDPIGDFSVQCDTNATSICVDPVNLSVNVDGGSTYLWYFPNGTPTTSTDEFPTVCYDNAGYQDAALVVTNSVGSDSIYITDYTFIRQHRNIPYLESFEPYSDFSLTDNWTTFSDVGNATFMVDSTVSRSGARSAKLQNYGQPAERVDRLISGPVDLSVVDTSLNEILTLSFRYAYRKRLEANDEWLRVKTKNSCSSNWATRRTIHGNTLSDIVSPTSWSPTSLEDWVTVHVQNITANYFVPDFQFMFEFTSDLGNNLFIEDINIYKGSPSEEFVVDIEEFNQESFTVYPNPASDYVTVMFSLSANSPSSIVLSDLNGKVIQSFRLNGNLGENLIQLETKDLDAGSYFVHVISEKVTATKKIEIIH